MLKKVFAAVLLIISSIVFAAAQTADAAKTEKEEKLKTDAVAFLRETSSEIASLRTPENRIGFSSELAGLMWFQDEKEARVMFNGVTNDFRQMLTQLDAQLNTIKPDEENSEMYGGSFLRGASRQAQIYRKLSKAISVRQQIALAISEHDALLAYSFYNDTATAITNPKFREQISRRDVYFEMRLLQAVAGQDAAKGLELGRKSLDKGVNYNHLEILKKIYAKDADSGAAFGEDIAKKLKTDGDEKAENIYLLNSAMSLGLENRKAVKGKTQKPLFSEQDLRDIAETAAQTLLKNPETISSYEGTIDSIEQLLPSRAVQLRQKLKITTSGSVNSTAAVPDRAVIVSNKIAGNEDQEKALEDLKNLGANKLSDEQRAKVIAEAGTMIEKLEDPSAKVTALSGLAIQIAKSGDRETALQIMKQAESFVNQTPKNYVDYLQLWILASSYSQVDAEKSFPVLENAVSNLNDTISAFVKVAEFIDTNGEIIEDGEVQVGGFGGGMTRELLGGLTASDQTLKHLAEADFPRARNLTNKFDRTEVRILAKMLVLRAVFGSPKNVSADSEMIEN